MTDMEREAQGLGRLPDIPDSAYPPDAVALPEAADADLRAPEEPTDGDGLGVGVVDDGNGTDDIDEGGEG